MAVAYEQRPNSQLPWQLEQLFWAHQQRVIRAAYRITGNMADAEDVAQAVFLRLLNAGGTAIDNPESYLYRGAINGALDLLRRRKSAGEVGLESAADVVSTTAAASPEVLQQDAERRRWLRAALTVLSARAAEMFVLRYIEERDNREIAELLGTSRAVVAVMLHHARAKVRKQFERYMRGER